MSIVFVDLEVNQKDKVVDFGAYVDQYKSYHGSREGFSKFIKGYDYICGHNVFSHDLKYITNEVKDARIKKCIDTLALSPLLFAERPYHKLVKNYKLEKDEKNDPFVDASLTHNLFVSLIEKFHSLDEKLKMIYFGLLGDRDSFSAFFDYVNYKARVKHLDLMIESLFENEICMSINLIEIIHKNPEELAYCLAIINVKDPKSIYPEWLIHKYDEFIPTMNTLRGVPCNNCTYCNNNFDAVSALKKYFGFDSYKLFNGEKLQEEAVTRQLIGKSLIVVFPTAGGKSISFQVPALVMGEAVKGLTVVISPLQSLMQDQVENLRVSSINNVGTINGGMNLLERKNTIERVNAGEINILYIAPESLRSPSIFKLLARRNIVRFVIDEAHCFSTWGHDFRVDYLYIATFIKKIQDESLKSKAIPISCFTATAKKEVVEDISKYFLEKLGIQMDIITTDTRRKNLSFFVHDCKGHHAKMSFIKDILDQCGEKPVIIYTSRRKAAEEVAYELNRSGFSANFFHGGMRIDLKNTHQLEFTKGTKNIIVATSAFGMGVDKKDVAYVIHYQVSSTIEDYIQEAGRGGRDESIQAECHILYDEKDVDEHFNMITQQKLSQSEINQIWRTIKNDTKKREEISISSKELARRAGWDLESISDVDTKVKTCILALENAGYVERKENSAQIYASSIVQKTMVEVSKKISLLVDVSEEDKIKLRMIMTALFTDKTTSPSRGTKAISMIDDLYDQMTMEKYELIKYISLLRDKKILELHEDLTAQIPMGYDRKKSHSTANKFLQIMRFLVNEINENHKTYNVKELNSKIKEEISNSDPKSIGIALNFLDSVHIVNQVNEQRFGNHRSLNMKVENSTALKYIDNLADISNFIIDYSYDLLDNELENKTVSYSIVELKDKYLNKAESLFEKTASLDDIEKALLFIIRCGALVVDGGFLVIYNPMKIKRIEANTQKQYTQADYKYFQDYYINKIKKIHILTHFIRSLSNNNEEGMVLVSDYFKLSYPDFEKKYITKEYLKYIDKPITKTRYNKLFLSLSKMQKSIIDDDSDKNIVVLAGPGSGKTTLLVHKLASLILLEDVKLSELLMLTFSRSATIVFKKKLEDLIGKRANYIAIKTFHSFCFDIIGEVGNLEKTEDLFEKAIKCIRDNDAEDSIVSKTTLVIDEAQDMSESEFELVQALIEYNEKMRVIAVGDDDQNIYEFRGSNSKFFFSMTEGDCNKYELIKNYRSKKNLVEFTQQFAKKINVRYKENACEAYAEVNGYIRVFKHISKEFYSPIVSQVKMLDLNHPVAVLTDTNEEAEIMTGLLLKEGINARLIQSNNGFRLSHLYEIDSFLHLFDEDESVITSEIWKQKNSEFHLSFEASPLYLSVLELLKGFEILYPEKKYFVDLKSYIAESKLEDLYNVENNSVTVSTIHKSKGREFDTVFLMQTKTIIKQEDLRAIYVGITRAKNNLVIHTNIELFDSISCNNLTRQEDDEQYEKPDELVMQLEHKDINLGGSKYCVNIIRNIVSGTQLEVTEKGCDFNEKPALYYSNSMQEKIEQKRLEGYEPFRAAVYFKVKWYSLEENKEYWILLPKLFFRKLVLIEEVDPVLETK